ncbi:DoxX family protein [Actinoplanes couchii]|uniref:Membrane protein n=1 Tax=Actinoplanes couchii TaxID=403638 RepID=A0ABQ3X1W3_9ACTN|nr:hypothetical protein [Actinoplanes couchii]MDR6316906.1 putative membrane protein [Actinoplanes couchii]GID52513.1 membrane protein [Actinoplanes couchii]
MGLFKNVAQGVLGGFLTFAGTAHLTVARQEFQAQVPDWVPVGPDLVVVASGIVEILLGVALLTVWRHPARRYLGWIVAAFFVAIFPGNVAQWLDHRDGFGLDTDSARLTRLFFQPVLVIWALFATHRSRRATE